MLNRTFEVLELELTTRAHGGDGRTVSGIAVPYDVPKMVSDDGITRYREVIRHGAFAKTIREQAPAKVKLFTQHAHKYDGSAVPIGAGKSFREDAAGLFSEFRVSRTAAGDEAIALIEDGTLDSFSVGMNPIRANRLPDGTVERTEARLFEVSLVWNPAYEEAKILALRDEPQVEATAPVTQGMSLAEARRIASLL